MGLSRGHKINAPVESIDVFWEIGLFLLGILDLDAQNLVLNAVLLVRTYLTALFIVVPIMA